MEVQLTPVNKSVMQVLKWAIDNGCPWEPEKVPKKALKKNGYMEGVNQDVLKWGHSQGLWIEFKLNNTGYE